MISRRPLPRYVIISGAHRPLFVDDHKLCPTEPDPKRTAPARPPGVPQGPAIAPPYQDALVLAPPTLQVSSFSETDIDLDRHVCFNPWAYESRRVCSALDQKLDVLVLHYPAMMAALRHIYPFNYDDTLSTVCVNM
jgi:hypothetical protein